MMYASRYISDKRPLTDSVPVQAMDKAQPHLLPLHTIIHINVYVHSFALIILILAIPILALSHMTRVSSALVAA